MGGRADALKQSVLLACGAFGSGVGLVEQQTRNEGRAVNGAPRPTEGRGDRMGPLVQWTFPSGRGKKTRGGLGSTTFDKKWTWDPSTGQNWLKLRVVLHEEQPEITSHVHCPQKALAHPMDGLQQHRNVKNNTCGKTVTGESISSQIRL